MNSAQAVDERFAGLTEDLMPSAWPSVFKPCGVHAHAADVYADDQVARFRASRACLQARQWKEPLRLQYVFSGV